VIWAALNGAFLLMDDVEIFRDITGLEAARLLEETFEFQLAAAEAAAKRSRRSRADAVTKSLKSSVSAGRSVKSSRNGATTNQHDNGTTARPTPARQSIAPLE
jgi:hypothetical protein